MAYGLDWMAQGTRVSKNLMYDNDLEDVFFEVDHGPTLVDINLLLSPTGIRTQSEGGAFVHNLIAGQLCNYAEPGRFTPYHLPHSTLQLLDFLPFIPGTTGIIIIFFLDQDWS